MLAFVCIVFVARLHKVSRRKIKEIRHGHVYLNKESNASMTNMTMLRQNKKVDTTVNKESTSARTSLDISSETTEPKELKTVLSRPECNFRFNKKINRMFMIANNPNPSKSVIDFVKETTLTDEDIVVRFNHGLHMDWWNNRTDLNFFRKNANGYYGLPEGFSRNGLHCVIHKHPSVIYDGINGRLDMHKPNKITKKSPSTGFAAIVVARDNIPKSKIYLLGFTFHGLTSSRTHNFTDENKIAQTIPNVINVGKLQAHLK